MKRLLVTVAALLIFSFAAYATDYAQFETFLGYTYTRFETGNFIPAPFNENLPSFNAHGGSAQVSYYFNRWFGLTFDAGAVHGTGVGNFGNNILFPSTFSRGGADMTLANYLLGPRVKMNSHGRFQPYIQTLFGGATAWQSLPVPNVAFVNPLGGVILPTGANLQFARTTSGFAMTAGGGIDIKMSRHVYIRPIQAEYFLTRLSPIGQLGITNRNNFRYSAGITFEYGHPK